MNFEILANLINIEEACTGVAMIKVNNGIITGIERIKDSPDPELYFASPGFIDSHVHIESSMLIPSEFARLAVVHGTVASISDPHEIANVCGIEGVDFMIQNGNSVPFKFYFGAPSCVPATVFETSGAVIDAEAVDELLSRPEIRYLSEMMNFPGVLNNDPEVFKKIKSAQKYNKPVDGHAPALTGDDAIRYINAGISTDHECFTEEEALFKIKAGMKILIREGSAAKNFNALIGLLNNYPDDIMFCSDDKHPDSLVYSHINELCARAKKHGIDTYIILRAACINPIKHYNLDVGQLRTGDPADFILLKDLENFEVAATYINGNKVSENDKSLVGIAKSGSRRYINNFNAGKLNETDLKYPDYGNSSYPFPVINAADGQLITKKFSGKPISENGFFVSDLNNDILKIVVVNRYSHSKPAIAFIHNFNLKKGALASSVAHDSHNIVAIGADDQSIINAVNAIIDARGGISCYDGKKTEILELPVAGIMSDEDGYKIAAAYTKLDGMVKSLGSTLSSPFMTLSFMALLVIPHLKLSDKGLFDGDTFRVIDPV